MREVIKEGRDVNEAIDLACAQLGLDRGQVSFEIIELPKTSLFGLRKKPAKVRVYVEEPETPKIKVPAPAKKETEKTAVRQEPKPERQETKKEARREAAPKMEQPKTVQKQEKIIKPQTAVKEEKPVKLPEKPPVPEKPAETSAVEEASQKDQSEHQLQFIPMEEAEEGKISVACAYVKSVLLEMGVDAKITVARTESGIIIRLAGEGLGVVIGRRGETLDALQYLSGLVANRCEGDYLRVTIDTGNYREKRERTLQQLARKLSASALRSGRSSMLEPMNPYERRIIHSTVSTVEGVTSSSIGEEPNRRVVISPVNAKPRAPRKGGPGQGGGPRRNGTGTRRPPRDSGDFRERPPRRDRTDRPERVERPRRDDAQVTSTAVDREYAKELEREPAFAKPEQPRQESAERITREKPKDEAGDLPLYGKIEL